MFAGSTDSAVKTTTNDPFSNAFGAQLDLGTGSKPAAPSTTSNAFGGWDTDEPVLPIATQQNTDPFGTNNNQINLKTSVPPKKSNIVGDPFGAMMGPSSGISNNNLGSFPS